MSTTAHSFSLGKPINFNPGIDGFIKATRHSSGASLVMTRWKIAGTIWLGTFWVKRLAHNALRWAQQYYREPDEITRETLEGQFDYRLAVGPPLTALCDRQRLLVYDWEDDNIFPGHDRPMPWHGCIFFTKYVWDRVSDGSPLILSCEGRARHALSLGGKIHLPDDDPEYRTKPIILHEIAHELAKFDQHGPTFVSTYMDLCVRFLGMNQESLKSSARMYNVDYLR